MLLPGSYIFSILLLILSMLCWGSWANTFKLAGGKWRFELFYFDFAFGLAVAALIAALTFGSMGWDGFSFLDDVRNAGKRQDLYAFAAGAVFNLANMLLVASISLAGMAVAFPVGIGLALVIGVVWNYIVHPVGNPVFLGVGCFAIVVAIVLNAMAFASYSTQKQKSASAPGRGKIVRKSGSGKGIVVAIISGIFMGSFYPLVEMAKQSEIGLGPYAIAVIFGLGVLTSTFVYNLFFMNLPLQGQPVELGAYFRGAVKQHALGVLGGALWCTGAVANFVAAKAEGAAQVGPAVSYAMGQGATLISALWGIMLWKEFTGARSKVQALIAVMLLLFVGGLTLVSIAPLFAAAR